MKVTRSQKICFGLLGLGLVALVADRSFGGAGEAAVAQVVAAPPAAIRTGDAPAVAESPSASTPVLATPTLATRLRALVSDDALAGTAPDAFKVPAAWSAVSKVSTDVTATAFKSTHALKAVLGTGRGGRALLDDQLLAVGDVVGGFELVDVCERHAVFAGPAGRITLELPGPPLGR